MPSLERTIRPFQDQDVTPLPFHPQGGASVPPVDVRVGIKGGTTTFSFSDSSNLSTNLGDINTEKKVGTFNMATGKPTAAR